MNRGRWFFLCVIVVAVGLFFILGPDQQIIVRHTTEWRELARADLSTSLAVFFVAEVILVGLSLPVGIWFTVLGGYLFGVWIGTVVVSVAATVGAILSFLSARYLFADAIHRIAKRRPRLNRWLRSIDRGLQEHGAYYVVLLRMTPVFPFWMLNLGLGLTRVRLWDYWWATQVGMLPITLVVANAGASLATVTSFRDVLSLRVLGALCLMPLVPFVLHHTVGRWLIPSEQEKPEEPTE
jgi:uncharacterized membrane protein YdjX (TVP38/TMEM64 family)